VASDNADGAKEELSQAPSRRLTLLQIVGANCLLMGGGPTCKDPGFVSDAKRKHTVNRVSLRTERPVGSIRRNTAVRYHASLSLLEMVSPGL
jgi:hypothetical protein